MVGPLKGLALALALALPLPLPLQRPTCTLGPIWNLRHSKWNLRLGYQRQIKGSAHRTVRLGADEERDAAGIPVTGIEGSLNYFKLL